MAMWVGLSVSERFSVRLGVVVDEEAAPHMLHSRHTAHNKSKGLLMFCHPLLYSPSAASVSKQAALWRCFNLKGICSEDVGFILRLFEMILLCKKGQIHPEKL